jgi:chemotaxis protein histidine kinase CheA
MTESLPLSWNASALAVGDGKSPDDVFLVELLLIFAKEVVEHCKCIIKCERELQCTIQCTATNEPFKAMRLQFHAIKGSASMLKLTRLTQISTKFENVLLCANADSTTSSVISQLALDDFFKEVMAVLQFIDIGMLDMTLPSGINLNSILSNVIQEQIQSESRSATFSKVLQARLSTIKK